MSAVARMWPHCGAVKDWKLLERGIKPVKSDVKMGGQSTERPLLRSSIKDHISWILLSVVHSRNMKIHGLFGPDRIKVFTISLSVAIPSVFHWLMLPRDPGHRWTEKILVSAGISISKSGIL